MGTGKATSEDIDTLLIAYITSVYPLLQLQRNNTPQTKVVPPEQYTASWAQKSLYLPSLLTHFKRGLTCSIEQGKDAVETYCGGSYKDSASAMGFSKGTFFNLQICGQIRPVLSEPVPTIIDTV